MNEKNFADVFDDIPIKKTTIHQIFILRKTKKKNGTARIKQRQINYYIN